jgi:hypothetical protein
MGHGAVLLYNGTGGSNAEIFLKNGRNCKKKNHVCGLLAVVGRISVAYYISKGLDRCKSAQEAEQGEKNTSGG